MRETSCRKFNTPHGYVNVITPEALAFDLVDYPIYGGGYSNILTVLEELVEEMDLEEFEREVNRFDKKSVLQRLGFLLDLLKLNDFASIVEKRLFSNNNRVLLDVRCSLKKSRLNKKWKVLVNVDLESDL